MAVAMRHGFEKNTARAGLSTRFVMIVEPRHVARMQAENRVLFSVRPWIRAALLFNLSAIPCMRSHAMKAGETSNFIFALHHRKNIKTELGKVGFAPHQDCAVVKIVIDLY